LWPQWIGQIHHHPHVLGLLPPTRGDATVLGYDIRALPPEARRRIGYLTEEHQLYGWMTVRECAEFQSGFYPRWSQKIFQESSATSD